MDALHQFGRQTTTKLFILQLVWKFTYFSVNLRNILKAVFNDSCYKYNVYKLSWWKQTRHYKNLAFDHFHHTICPRGIKIANHVDVFRECGGFVGWEMIICIDQQCWPLLDRGGGQKRDPAGVDWLSNMAEGMLGAFGELSARVVEVVSEWAGSPYIVWRFF